MLLSILIPAYNESRTIIQLLNRVKDVELIQNVEKQFVIINDCSTDNTEALIHEFSKDNPSLNIIYKKQEINQGKGAALHTGIDLATGDYIVIQDADLEYDPEEYNELLIPVLNGYADVVYGSRFMGGKPHRILFFWHSIGNNFLTFLS